MKTLTTLFATTFALFTFTANAQTKLINDGTAADLVIMNNIAKNGTELKFEKGANGASISWQTAAESNTSHFELQLSYDNKTFETIKVVAASDMTQWSADYQVKFNRTYIAAEKVYYRVKTVFITGAESFTSAGAFETLIGNAVSYVSIH